MVNNRVKDTASTMTIAWLAVGTLIGTLAALLVLEKRKNSEKHTPMNSEQKEEEHSKNVRGQDKYQRHHHCDCIEEKRRLLPEMIILLRHGESEAQADDILWRTKPDNMINLTENGIQQSKEAGKRIEELFESYGRETSKKINRVQIHVSPFERTLQTAMAARPYFDHRVVQTLPESRIREQEAGNFSKHDTELFREEQIKVGRFWYRFPTGESGADVYDRVKSWWYESVLTTNERVGYEPVDAIVVVTHSLSMRFVLMQLYNWSPTTFHSVWNTEVCNMYVLRKDLNQRGMSPYVLDRERGDMPRSSVDLFLTFKNDETANTINEETLMTEKDDDEAGGEIMYRLHDYLDVPPPRMKQIGIIKQKLSEQYPGLNVDAIDTISFKINDAEMNEEEQGILCQ